MSPPPWLRKSIIRILSSAPHGLPISAIADEIYGQSDDSISRNLAKRMREINLKGEAKIITIPALGPNARRYLESS